METTTRVFGLDVLRVTAIGMVLTAQCAWVFPQWNVLLTQMASMLHFIGLEIFFVLSGFLLAKMMWPLFLKDNFDWTAVAFFIKKRVLQILPLYYVAFAINFAIARSNNYPTEQSWKYILLLQNFISPMPGFFPESWGLPVILFSILLLPLLLGFLYKLQSGNKRNLFLAITVGLIFLGLLLKWIYSAATTNTDITRWDSSLKSVVIYRFDSVFIGVLFGLLAENLKKIRILLALLGCFGMLFLSVGVGYFQWVIEYHPLFWNVFYLPLTSMIIGLFLPFLYEWQSFPRFIKKPVSFISKIIYPMYMVYFSIVHLLMKWIFPQPESLVLYSVFYLIIVIALGSILHYFFRKRFFESQNTTTSL